MRNISAAVHAGIAVLAGLAGACGQATASPGLPTPPLIPVAPGLAPGSYMYNYNVIPVGPPALFDARGIRAGATGDPASQATGMPGSALGPGPWKSNFLGTSANTRLHINAGEAPAQQSNTPGPVIGAINGVAITGGFELALACDVLIGSTSARFADTHARVGIMPGWGLSQKLSRLVGVYRAKELSLSGNFLDARTAEAWGLLNRVVAPAELVATAHRLAADMATIPVATLAAYKQLIDDGFDESFGQARALEHNLSSAYNRQVTPAAIEARRASIQARGRTQ